MTDNEILEMAKQAGFHVIRDVIFDCEDTELITFARLIAEKQKEIDAEVCEREVCDRTRPSPTSHAYQRGALQCAAAIREQVK
jgi:hypothetical protein